MASSAPGSAGPTEPQRSGDTASLALTLVGAVHQLLLTRGPHAPDLRERLRRLATTLIGR
ncbi:hypothetical protein ACIBIZ_09245 [Nonomuraea spiralis]|uniref:hypothetical protein n=1 Tax=Nonomuraea TaxID=83681 RepID=UPI000F7B8AEE|nr:hypothetical protein [Nonomuraea sp. WAC 01424]RSN09281.1 hypothetical protein DMB42_18385 [Nonomuraea sp. WAC 01424]